jgi:hypothetical protein
LFGVTVNCPSTLVGKGQAFATVLAIAILRVRFGDRKSQWGMIEKKALLWLGQQATDAEALVAEIAGQL